MELHLILLQNLLQDQDTDDDGPSGEVPGEKRLHQQQDELVPWVEISLGLGVVETFVLFKLRQQSRNEVSGAERLSVQQQLELGDVDFPNQLLVVVRVFEQVQLISH
ncbi:hypothetical protein WICPIJ_005464 [Wickerhamomyces pijperi]|uniref:Uncharacterized protein n=1 Tax=Wickerhamomyces pijperi TaxID=599730 RepID=A0A9P8TL36_WICPI|nr:hypothetical protein WICPIJ_005464 [Wickerhamomyces pijperi]